MLIDFNLGGGRKFRIHYGDKYWEWNESFHRENGPAVEYVDGTRIFRLKGEGCLIEFEHAAAVSLARVPIRDEYVD